MHGIVSYWTSAKNTYYQHYYPLMAHSTVIMDSCCVHHVPGATAITQVGALVHGDNAIKIIACIVHAEVKGQTPMHAFDVKYILYYINLHPHLHREYCPLRMRYVVAVFIVSYRNA